MEYPKLYSKALLQILLGIFLIWIVIPGVALVFGIWMGRSIAALEASEQVTQWRRARLALRAARFSPLMWQAADRNEALIDRTLSSAYLKGTIEGTTSEPTEHLRFLENRSSSPQWRRELLETRLRYGLAEEVLSVASSAQDAPVAVAAALILGDREALTTWLPRAGEDASDALRLVAGLPLPEPTVDEPLAHFLYAESLRRSGDLSGAAARLRPLMDGDTDIAAMAHAAWMLATPAAQTPPSKTTPAWMGSWLLAAARAEAPEAAQAATAGALRCAADQLPGLLTPYMVLRAPYLPHPDLFDGPLERASGEDRARLLLLQARAALQGLDISRAQQALKVATEHPMPPELDGERLMLRVLARELAADLPGALRYAQEGEAIPRAAIKMHFKHLQARLLLQGAQGDAERTAALQLLDSLANYPLTPALRDQRNELLGLAIQQTGEQEPFQLAGEEMPADLYIDDAVFRLCFARYVDHLSHELDPSAALAMLRYWRAASQRGEFLIGTRLGDAVSPHSALVRAHLQFARQRLHDGDNRGWKHFTMVRELVSSEPFRALLPLSSVALSDAPSGS